MLGWNFSQLEHLVYDVNGTLAHRNSNPGPVKPLLKIDMTEQSHPQTKALMYITPVLYRAVAIALLALAFESMGTPFGLIDLI